MSGRITRVTDEDDNQILYGYDEMGNLSSYTYDILDVDREVYYVYNQTTHEYEYTFYQTGNQDISKYYHIDETDSLRRVNCIELVIGTISFTEHISYKASASGRGNTSPMIASIQYRKDDAVRYTMNYTYDYLGNIASVTKTVGQNMIEWHTYLYDGFNRLTREMVDLGSTEYTKFYTYDSRGNITAIKTYQSLIDVPNGTPFKETDITYKTTGWKDQISVIREYLNGALQNTLTYSYDAIGNVTSIDSTLYDQSFVWEGRRLIEHNLGGETYTYTYDDQGIRTSKSDGNDTTYYILDGSKVLAEKKGNNVIYYTYDVDGSILSMNYQGNEYFYIKNMEGDIIEIVDASGYSVATYTYDAWGNIIDQWGISGIDDINPYRYRGYRYDQETGLYYLNSRYYDPHLGRFISADSISYLDPSSETGLNLYAYCGNNPVMYVDPEGDSYIALIIVISVMLSLILMSVAPSENNAVENASISWSATPDPLTLGIDFLGVGYSGTFGQPAVSCDFVNGCKNITQYGLQIGPFSINYTENTKETNTTSISFIVFYASIDDNNFGDISSWHAGLTFGFSAGSPGIGSGSSSLDIDFLGLIIDLIHRGDENE